MTRTLIYNIAYPNVKIYVGQDATNSVYYFGNAISRIIAKNITAEERLFNRTCLRRSGYHQRQTLPSNVHSDPNPQGPPCPSFA
jgi:hypothetical protein